MAHRLNMIVESTRVLGLVGIVASGLSCLVLGSADFVFIHPQPAKGSPVGDGTLRSSMGIVLLRGTEGGARRRQLHDARRLLPSSAALIRSCSVLFFI
ncbi:hypothetical protein OG21DRAFT_856874 [Imleria badia]|nr:hypothetical protein OG21DRAFT_856874 [Imleria badia]